MKAEEARKLSEKNQPVELDEVYECIQKACEEGKYLIHFYEVLTHAQIEELRKQGYKVKDISERNETIIRIDWSPRPDIRLPD